MKILVTGAKGLLGCTLVPYLQTCGHTVLKQSRRRDAEVLADLTDTDQTIVALNRVAPDVIVNLAAATNVDECERNPQCAYVANVRIVENLANWVKQRETDCHLVQISTDQVYDGAGPHKEEDITLTNYYGFSKYAGELVAATVPNTILRTNFFGPSQCSGKASLSDWLVRSLTKKEPITVFEDVCFSPLSLRRLVELIELVIGKHRQGIYNLGSRDGMSKADFAFSIAKALDLPTDSMRRGFSTDIKLAAYRPKDMRMNSNYFEETFGIALPTLNDEIYAMKAAYDYETR